MKKENREMLKTIISNQELIMKALKIEIPVKKSVNTPRPSASKKVATKKTTVKKAVKKTAAK